MSKLINMPRRDAKWAENSVRRILALGEEHVIISRHAKDRITERGFTRTDLMRALGRGFVMSAPEKTGFPGEWKCKVEYRLKVTEIAA